MNLMFKYKLRKSLLSNFFLIGSFLYIVSSINNPFIEINFSSIHHSINTFRGLSPYLLMPILLIYLLFYEKNLKIEWIYILFLFYLTGQLLGFIINPYGYSYHVNSQNQIYWLICNFTTVLYFYIIRDKKKFNILILKVFILIISIIAIKFLYEVYVEFFQTILIKKKVVYFFYNFTSMSPNKLFLDQPVPRSSGLSRMIIIIFLFLYGILFFTKNLKTKKILLLILLGFIAFSIFNLQNRVSILFMFGLLVFSLVFKISEVPINKKIIFLFSIFIVPFFIHINIGLISSTTIDFVKKINETDTSNDKDKDINKIIVKDKDKDKDSGISFNNYSNQRILSGDTSGRKTLWGKTISLFFKNNFKGFGPQADREMLNQNVSSLYFYSMICGGIVSLIAIILISIILFFKSIKMIFIENIFKSNQMFVCFSLLIIGFLYLRSIVEITFGLFGIDMILFFITFNILRNSESY